jgi:DNA-binding GntR family transcriptional regulator
VPKASAVSAALVKLAAAPRLVERVHRALLDAIGDGTLPPGARLTQEDLAERLAVSRQPVLQALRLLKQSGLALDAPGRGLVVAPLDAERIADVYEVRAALDALAARLAARRRAALDPQLLERGRRAARGRDIRAMVEADEAIHHAIYAASGNPLIAASAEPHWVQLRRVMAAVLQSSGQREPIWDEHAAIADAIAHGATAEAARLVEDHARRASTHLRARLAELAPAPQASLSNRTGTTP